MNRRLLPLIFGLLALSGVCVAQQAGPTPVVSADASNSQRPRFPDLTSAEADMLKRARLRREEQSHRELRERADEAAQIGAELQKAFDSGRGLTRADVKKLERVEKLARQIRSSAGGSDDDARLEDPPADLGPAVSQLAELAGELNEEVRKTSRLVVSGAVIDRSNRLIEMVRLVRSMLPR